MIKVYAQPTCHYCKKIKDTLNEANIAYEEIVTSENVEEWNELIRITGIGMTPTIVMQNEVWLPNRDFRTPEELVGRIKHFESSPIKNITLLLNQMQQTIQRINTQVAGTPQQPPQQPQQVPTQQQPQQMPQQ